MQFILPWNNGIANYQTGVQDLEITRPERCPQCGCGKFHKWGRYGRYVVEASNEHYILVQRIRCVKCHKTYSYLPSFCLSGICYGLDFVMKILEALLLKMELSFERIRRRAFAFLRRFVESEALWLTFLRARGFGIFPRDRRERLIKVLSALLEIHREGILLASFLQETGRHFLSTK